MSLGSLSDKGPWVSEGLERGVRPSRDKEDLLGTMP